MRSDALKNELLDWVSKLENETILDALKGLKDTYNNKDWYLNLSEDNKASIKQGLDDLATGKTLTSKEFWSE